MRRIAKERVSKSASDVIAGSLPLCPEDRNFAPEIGRWLCQLTLSARNFFEDEVSAAQQFGPGHRGRRLAVIPYEGLREKKRLIAKVHETSAAQWLAELTSGAGDFRWRAEIKPAEGQTMRVRALNGENQQIYLGKYHLKSAQPPPGRLAPRPPEGLARSTHSARALQSHLW